MNHKLRHIKDILWVLALAGLIAAIFRLWYGLGATTNLSDAMPWGLWKVFNMVAGVALSTSGFMIGLLVYVLRLERFRPYLKPAILIAFLGYGCSCTALLFDIGLPLRFWHPILMWNEHSFLFEVFWCVLLYFTITTIELLPTVLERFRTERIVRWLHRISFGVVVVGISLSSLHHSSLGSLFLVTPTRLHALWYTSWLPIFFIISAAGGGIMVVVLVRILYARWYDPEPVFGPDQTEIMGQTCVIADPLTGIHPQVVRGREMSSLSQLAIIGTSLMALYLGLKLIDLIRLENWEILFAGSWESWLYSIELLFTAALPVILVAVPKTRRSPVGLGVASLSAATGLVLNRLDVGIFGYFHNSAEVYFPSVAEWSLGIGVVAAAALVFLYVSESFAIFDENWRERRLLHGLFQPAFDSLSQIWNTALSNSLHRVSLIAVFVIPLAWIIMYPPFSSAYPSAPNVEPSAGIDPARAVLRIDGNRSGVRTDFHHAEHQARLGGDSACTTCHHVSLPKDNSTPCSRCHQRMVESTSIFDHPAHLGHTVALKQLDGLCPENMSCDICHQAGEPRTATTAKSCVDCHAEDIWRNTPPFDSTRVSLASSFTRAMHGTCVRCHAEQALLPDGKPIDECGTCHVTRRNARHRLDEMAGVTETI